MSTLVQPSTGGVAPAVPLAVPAPASRGAHAAGYADDSGGVADPETDDADEDEEEVLNENETAREMHNEEILRSGYLFKRGEKRKTWKKRWFVLRSSRLAYYKNQKEYMLLQVIRASEMRAVAAVELKRVGLTMCIVTPSRTYYIRARDANETYAWIDDVNRVRAEDAEARSGTLPQQLQSMHMHGAGTSASGASGRSATPGSAAPPLSVSPGTASLSVSPGNASLSVSPGSDGGMSFNAARWRPPRTSRSTAYQPPVLSSSEEDGELEMDEYADQAMPLPSHVTASSAPSAPAQRAAPPAGAAAGSGPGAAAGSAAAPGTPAVPEDPHRVIVQGYLMKQSNRHHHWRNRYFVLTPASLTYSRTHMDHRVHRRVPVESILDVMECPASESLPTSPTSGAGAGAGAGTWRATSGEHGDAEHAPGIISPRSGAPPLLSGMRQRAEHAFRVVTPNRPFVLSAPTEEEEIQWLSAFQTLLNRRRNARLAPSSTPLAAPAPQ